MLKSKLAAAVLAALALGLGSIAQAAATTTQATTQTATDQSSSTQQDSQSSDTTDQTTDAEKKAKRLDAVTVTGSLINNAQIQTAAPVYTITAEDIKARGFTTVAEALQGAVQATGAVQGAQSSASFTQGAQAVSLYGLNPEFTLTLIDGKPITQFGQLYNGQSNFTNISNIPLSMVDHIDILPGGASSIYGSNAIAGVINIITKQHMDGVEVFARTSNYKDGGGANQTMSITFGHDFGKLNVLGSFEFDNASPIWAYQRSLTRQVPSGSTNEPAALVAQFGTVDDFLNGLTNYNLVEGGYLSAPDNCAADSVLFHGTTVASHSSVASRTGTYCGSPNVLGYTTLGNASRSYDGMLKLKYDINDHVRLYSDVLVDWQQERLTPGSDYNFWEASDEGTYLDDVSKGVGPSGGGTIILPERIFGPEEVGDDYYSQLGRQDDLMYQADIGAKGTFGESNWDWDVYFLRSGDRTSTSTPSRMAAPMDAFFDKILRPVDPGNPDGYDALGLEKVNPNYQALYSPITPAQFASFTQNINSFSNTWINNTHAQVTNSSLFSLPGGDASLAILAEGGSQAWYQPANPLITSGAVWGQTATSGGGTRTHDAGAFEFNLPLLKQLTLDLSGRYDYYDTDQASDHRFTYKAGLEYRPFDTLLLRGSYSTAFLAPDMSSVFLGPSGFYEQVTDYYTCSQNGNKDCSQNFPAQVLGTTLSNPDLKPATAKSWTAGFVWAPLERMSISLDYLHIDIANEIQVQDVDQLLKTESQCRQNPPQLAPDSPDCVAAFAQVQRDPLTGQLSNIELYNVNIASESTESVTGEAKYVFKPTAIGTFGLQLDYNDMIKHSYVNYPGSPAINELTNPLQSSEFKSIVSGALTWSLHDRWSSTLYLHRYGPTPNYLAQVNGYGSPGAGKVSPWITANLSVTFTPIKGLDLSVLANNIANKMPPKDSGWLASFPYYNTLNYNIYGRQLMLQADYRFGGAQN
ncbi:TonB-dependent receptor [Rhodanobacter sp. L36]|uniref:TonB-dependent receptor plug domain-containing protein n=1 Tax=Rhodanobacter sp. L36 TaxID=1747221 RepID=UPI00131C1C9E|nr:TonB-dependent receptor [Rhodanobacter sp. L36]